MQIPDDCFYKIQNDVFVFRYALAISRDRPRSVHHNCHIQDTACDHEM